MFLALYFLSEAGAARSLPEPPTGDTGDNRMLFDIIFGCLATIFACTWVSVHPNVPPPGQGVLERTLRRLLMMLFAVVAPEIVVYFAARQFMFARQFVKEFNTIQSNGIGSKKSDTESSALDIETQRQLSSSIRQFFLWPRQFFESNRLAKVRKYKLSKTHGFFFAMGGFVSQSEFPITTLLQLRSEDAYLTAICAISEEEINDKSKGDALSKGLALLQIVWFITQCIGRQTQQLATTTLEIATIAFAVLNIFIWLLWWNKPLGVDVPIVIGSEDRGEMIPHNSISLRAKMFLGPMTGDYDSYYPEYSTSVPLFWSSGDETFNDYDTAIIVFEMIVGFVFGGIHCLGWNSHFPSSVELMMWKVAAVFTTAYPGMWAVFLYFEPKSQTVIGRVGQAIAYVGVPLYVVSRLFLLILPLSSLRDLPAGAFRQVDWTVYIPHL
ncbi:hypothetical protein C8J56DRAFT_91584 [Mycena floridula]|nr:hypothetical protein C8J56DRAFT_91584 [Mycena floridula]